VTRQLKDGIAEQEEMAIAMQWHIKHLSTVTSQHMRTDELVEAVFSMWSATRLYGNNQQEKLVRQKLKLVVRSHELQVRSGSSHLAM
jgi:hypothetical protein